MQHAGVALLESGGLPVPHHVFHHQAGDLPAARGVFDVDLVTGACLAIRRDLFESAGGFDERYVNGWEDMDLCLRVRSSGARIVYRGDVELVHHEGSTRGGVRGTDENGRLFYAAWRPLIDADRQFLATSFDGRQRPDRPRPERHLPGGPFAIGGHLLGPSPGADEGRALVGALEAAGLAPVIHEEWYALVEAAIDADQRELIERCLSRTLEPAALRVDVPDGLRMAPRWGTVARLGALPEGGLGDVEWVWASSPAAVDAVTAAGLHPDLVTLLPPPVLGVEEGPGGSGVLVALPAHDRAAVESLAAALAPLSDMRLRLLPNVMPNWLRAFVSKRLPQAELLPATAGEHRFAALAAESDVVVACDADEPHQRHALLAAAAGAAPVALPGGPAAYVLGELVALPGAVTPDAIRAAVERALGDTTSRASRAAAVERECGLDVTVARLRELAASAPVSPARAEPSSAPRR
jgi:hypothetical protein